MNDTYSIRAEKLHKRFGELPAVDGVSLQVKPGEIYGLVGPDGAGKTTTLRLLIGALKADEGEAAICGYSVSRQVEEARGTVGYLSQRFSLYEDLTVLENIRFFAEVRGLPTSEWQPRCMEILDFVGLAPYTDRRAGQLSGGMKQKLGLASALVSRPRVLLLDEPTTGVDPVTRQDFWQLLIQLVANSTENKNEKVAVVISTPYMDEAARCHRIGFMRKGKLIAEGSPSEIRSLLNGRVVELRGDPLQRMRELASSVEGVEDVHAFGDRLHLRVNEGKAEAVVNRLNNELPSTGITLIEVRSVPPVLEDVFIALSSQSD
jgi:ABC-2 type transport system ATP-binding protein